MNKSKISKHYKITKKKMEVFETSVKNSFNSDKCSSSSPSAASETVSCSNTVSSLLISCANVPIQSSSNSPPTSNDHQYSDSDSYNFSDPDKIELTSGSGTQPSKETNSLPLLISKWAIDHNITQVALTDLLKILKPEHPELPVDARSLLKTCRESKTIKIDPGEYFHFGLENCVHTLLQACVQDKLLDSIEILVNVDGLPLFKSSGSTFYPILVSLYGYKNVNFAGLYYGNSKPHNANSFLREFVDEAKFLTENGTTFQGKRLGFKIKGFICDAPAKTFISFTTGHSGYNSCTKCYIEGHYINSVCFPETANLKLRSDLDFRSKIQPEHHTGTSILEEIPNLDMIRCFPLDYMHLICLGVVKKLISFWCAGKPENKLSYSNILEISDLLDKQIKNIPSEFNRKPRPLAEFKRWKATEFRQFLLYTGPLVLKNIISFDKYINFLCLHVSVTILCSKHNMAIIGPEYTQQLLKYFVDTFITLYGKKHVSHNIHNLLHITEDAIHFGTLDTFSAFSFENFMQSIKKMVRKKEKPLQQVINRKSEIALFKTMNKTNVHFPNLKKEHFYEGPLLEFQNCSVSVSHFKEVELENCVLKISEPDNYCCLNDKKIVCIKNFIEKENEIFFFGEEVLGQTNFFGHIFG